MTNTFARVDDTTNNFWSLTLSLNFNSENTHKKNNKMRVTRLICHIYVQSYTHEQIFVIDFFFRVKCAYLM